MSDTFQCWVCQSKGQPCVSETFRKENYPTCEAASKGFGFPAFSTKKECNDYCVGDKPIDLTPVCWMCGGEKEDWGCVHYFGAPGEKCRDYSTKAACESECPFHSVIPPLSPIIIAQNKTLWYVIIAIIVVVLICLIIGAIVLLK